MLFIMRFQTMSFSPHAALVKLFDDIHALINSKRPAVQGNIIILRVSPLHIGIEAMVGCTALILILQALLRGFLPLPIFLDDPLCPEG